MFRIITVLFLFLFVSLDSVSAQSNFPRPKVAQKKADNPVPVKHQVTTSVNKEERKTVVKKSEPSLNSLNDYMLEMKAHAGNVEAQYLMGRRKLAENDSASEVLGINWLRQAQANGHERARLLLRNYRRKW
jgi:hypothetical protein